MTLHSFGKHFEDKVQKQKLEDIFFVFIAEIFELVFVFVYELVDERYLMLFNLRLVLSLTGGGLKSIRGSVDHVLEGD